MRIPRATSPRHLTILQSVIAAAASLGALACLSYPAAGVAAAPAPRPSAVAADPVPGVLSNHLLVTWYGNPRSTRMGILGEHKGPALARGLRRQADAYAPLTKKKIMPAYHLVAVIAQATPWTDKTWRRRETHDTIRAMLHEARAHGFKLIVDIQPGHSTVKAEMEYLRPYLEEPDVYLALDPEFAMDAGVAPGRKIGRMTADEVNDAIEFLERIVRDCRLPPKVLIVHQFTINMLREKARIRDSALVDVALDVDGFGDRPLKRAMYKTIMRQPLEYAGFKLFYREDTNLMTPDQVMKLTPEPAVVIYQ